METWKISEEYICLGLTLKFDVNIANNKAQIYNFMGTQYI